MSECINIKMFKIQKHFHSYTLKRANGTSTKMHSGKGGKWKGKMIRIVAKSREIKGRIRGLIRFIRTPDMCHWSAQRLLVPENGSLKGRPKQRNINEKELEWWCISPGALTISRVSGADELMAISFLWVYLNTPFTKKRGMSFCVIKFSLLYIKN